MIKILLVFNFPHDSLNSFDDWPHLKSLILKNNYAIFNRNDIEQLSSYLDYYKYFLRKIYEYKESDNTIYTRNDFLNHDRTIFIIFEETIFNDFIRGIMYGLTLEESLKMYEILNELIEENEIPDYFNLDNLAL